jgi:uncharacterized RDD family membrane protein YckC
MNTLPDTIKPYKIASEGRRLLNYIIDLGLLYIAYFFIIMVFPELSNEESIGPYILLAAYVSYYIGFEILFQKTPGKYVTGMKVVTVNGLKPDIGMIIGRTIIRLIPFDAISAIGSPKDKRTWWHDRWAGARVVYDE